MLESGKGKILMMMTVLLFEVTHQHWQQNSHEKNSLCLRALVQQRAHSFHARERAGRTS